MPIINNTIAAKKLQTHLDVISWNAPATDFLQAAIATTFTSSIQNFVCSCADLPDIRTANIPPGHIVHVNSIGTPVISTDRGWYTLDARLVRTDAATRCIWVWGLNSTNAYFGDGSTISTSSPTTSYNFSNWTNVAFGDTSAGVKTDGTLWTWGYGGYGNLGNNSSGTARSSPGSTAGGGCNWKSVYTDGTLVNALKLDGTMWAWGNGAGGKFGDGVTTWRSSPVMIGTTHNWACVSYASGLKNDGTLWMWGVNTNGAVGDGTTIDRSFPVTTAGGGTNWCMVSRYGGSAGIKTDGTLWTWGCNNQGSLGDGTTICRSSPVTTAGGGTNWCMVAPGANSFKGIKTDGTLWTWGQNGSGVNGNNSIDALSSPVTTAGGGTNWCFVSSKNYTAAGVKTDGTLWMWGTSLNGQLGDGTTVCKSSPVTTAGGGNNWICATASNSTGFGIRT